MSQGSTKQLQLFFELLASNTEKQTVGCRHSNPDICAKNSMPAVCASTRADNICLAPPLMRAKQFQQVLEIGPGNQ